MCIIWSLIRKVNPPFRAQNFTLSMLNVLFSSCLSFSFLYVFLVVTALYANIFSSCYVLLRHHTLWEWQHIWTHRSITTPYGNSSLHGNFCLNIQPFGNWPAIGCYSDLPSVIHHADWDEWPCHRCSVLNHFKYVKSHIHPGPDLDYGRPWNKNILGAPFYLFQAFLCELLLTSSTL